MCINLHYDNILSVKYSFFETLLDCSSGDLNNINKK